MTNWLGSLRLEDDLSWKENNPEVEEEKTMKKRVEAEQESKAAATQSG